MQITAAYNNGDKVFGKWIIQDCVEIKNEYTQYAVKGEDGISEASFWVVEFPVSADDYFVLCENGMTEEQAVDFFRQAAEDFIGSIRKQTENESENNLLHIEESDITVSDDGRCSTVMLLTKQVYSLQAYFSRHYMDAEDVVRLGIQMCKAVMAIKANELPCRLLTVDNIFVDFDKNFYLGCFGNEADIRFQSPEEHRGEQTVYNADVHSIGVIMYTLLNDNRLPLLPPNVTIPTESEIAAAVQNRHAGVPLPPPRHSSAALSGIVLKACAYKAKARFTGTDELKNTLESLRSGRVVIVSASSQQRVQTKETDKSMIGKTIAGVLTAVIVLVVSHFLIQFFSSEPSGQLSEKPTVTDSNSGFTVIVHTDPVVMPTGDSSTTVTDATENAAVDTISVDSFDETFFAQIAIYHGGNFYLKGTMEQDGEAKPTEVAVTKSNSIYMTSDIDGSLIGILRTPEAEVYLVDPAGKSYLELSPTVLKVLGMDTDVIDNAAASTVIRDEFIPPEEITKVVYREKELYRCVYTYDNGKQEVFYLDDTGVVLYIESYTAEGTLDNTMIISSITSEVPAAFISPVDGYQMYSGVSGMFNFVAGLPAAE